MKKGLKVLSTSLLLSTLFLAGCSCNKDDEIKNVSRITNSDAAIASLNGVDVSGYTMLDVYNALAAADSGNTAVANKLAEIVANEVLELDKPGSIWKPRYDAIVAEKLKELAESQEYKFNGKFSERLLQNALNYQGYEITCTAGNYGTTDDLECDYTDYINKVIKPEALSILLKQKYIQDKTLKDREDLLTSKKIRDVEYFTVSSSLDKTYTDLNVRDFMRELRDDIADGTVVDFSSAVTNLKDKMEEIVDKEYAKIGTKDDYSQSIFASYTNNYTQDKSVGYNNKINTINDSKFVFAKWIGADSEVSSIVSESITSAVLAISDPTSDAFARRVVKIGDYYYLVNQNAGLNVDKKDILLSESSDASTYTYSIVRFRVINSETTDQNDIYKAIELLAKESTLGNKALAYYLEEKKDAISVYDDDIKAYLSALYPDVFAE